MNGFSEQPLPQPPQPVQPSYIALPLYRPIVTWVLLGLIALVFVVETLAGGSTNPEVLIRLGAKYSPLIVEGEYWRLFTAMFLHVGLMHVAFNGYALLAIGIELERIVGAGRFLAIYLLSGLFGSLASFAFSTSLSAGASGAIFGLIGALAAFFLLHRERLGRWGRARLGNIVFWIGVNLVLGFTMPGIDNLGHIGGLLGGLALGWALVPRYQLDPLGPRLVDRNTVSRYWPALLLAVLLLIGGTLAASRLQADSPSVHLLRGQDAVDQEAWNTAAEELDLAVAGDPSLAEAHFLLGLTRNHLGQPRLAVPAYKAALDLEPKLSAAHWNLALTYLDLGQTAQARRHLETYLALEPGEAARVQRYLDTLPPD